MSARAGWSLWRAAEAFTWHLGRDRDGVIKRLVRGIVEERGIAA